jgi:chromodomain-helicase-DNA-binding protein 1
VLTDIEFLDKIAWQVIVLDEGHRIKNCKGKKNNMLRNLQVKHRIILTGTQIQNTLQELLALLRFVSPDDFVEDPDFLETEFEDLTDDLVLETKNMIQPHILRRTIAQAERTLAPKEERVVFDKAPQDLEVEGCSDDRSGI